MTRPVTFDLTVTHDPERTSDLLGTSMQEDTDLLQEEGCDEEQEASLCRRT